MTLLDLLDKMPCEIDAEIYENNEREFVFIGTVDCAKKTLGQDILSRKVQRYECDDDVLNIYVEVSEPEASEPEETVTIVENRHLRKTIHSVTTSCFLTKKEYMQIMGVIYNACDRTLKEVLKEAIKETDEDAKVN